MNMEQLLLAGSEGQDLKQPRGRQSAGEEGSKRSHTPLCALTHIDKTTYHMNNRGAARGTIFPSQLERRIPPVTKKPNTDDDNSNKKIKFY